LGTGPYIDQSQTGNLNNAFSEQANAGNTANRNQEGNSNGATIHQKTW
jgi:hypothetical protein